MIPPPMYASQITFDKAVLAVSHVPSHLTGELGHGIDLIVQSNSASHFFCQCQNNGSPTIVGELDLSYALSDSEDSDISTVDPTQLHQCQVVNMRADHCFIYLLLA